MAGLITTGTQYVGFWLRVAATLIDTVLLIMVTGPLILAIYDNEYLEISDQVADYWNLLISYVLPALAIIIFWFYKSATPGKMAVSAKIVDAKTGTPPVQGNVSSGIWVTICRLCHCAWGSYGSRLIRGSRVGTTNWPVPL